MPIYRNRSGKKIAKLYADEIRQLHSTKDLLADLTLNQPLVDEYDSAHYRLTKVCDLWPIPEPKKKKPKQESEPAKDAIEDAQEAIAESAYGQPGTGELPEPQQGQPSPYSSSNDSVDEQPEARPERARPEAAEGLAEKLVEGARLMQQQEAASTEANVDI